MGVAVALLVKGIRWRLARRRYAAGHGEADLGWWSVWDEWAEVRRLLKVARIADKAGSAVTDDQKAALVAELAQVVNEGEP